mmetsp:Transcript_69380/g.185091  ORF Transcript_69380/g.185091 Transcript_69380/m.185091 type:complete len:275 (-) Transcript_69380:444-1268(-)
MLHTRVDSGPGQQALLVAVVPRGAALPQALRKRHVPRNPSPPARVEGVAGAHQLAVRVGGAVSARVEGVGRAAQGVHPHRARRPARPTGHRRRPGVAVAGAQRRLGLRGQHTHRDLQICTGKHPCCSCDCCADNTGTATEKQLRQHSAGNRQMQGAQQAAFIFAERRPLSRERNVPLANKAGQTSSNSGATRNSSRKERSRSGGRHERCDDRGGGRETTCHSSGRPGAQLAKPTEVRNNERKKYASRYEKQMNPRWNMSVPHALNPHMHFASRN